MDTMLPSPTRQGNTIENVPHRRDVVLPTMPTIAEMLGNEYTDVVREAFPDVDPPTYPCGINILVQLRAEAKVRKMSGGKVIYFPDETVDANKARAQTGIVRALGPSAYRHRQTLDLWPEGHWCVPGMYVRVPMYGGDRLEVGYERTEVNDKGAETIVGDFVLFATFKDQDCLGIILGSPMKIKTG